MLENARFLVRDFVGRHPTLFYRTYGARRADRELCVGPDTDLVIEGFPRSGNSFVVAAFRRAQERPVNVAHHLHVPAQVIEAIRRHIAVLCLIRPPADVATSLKLFNPALSARLILRSYIRFYETILPCADGCVIAGFELATRHPEQVIARVNAKFGTDFTVPRPTTEERRKIFRALEQHSRNVHPHHPHRSAAPSGARESAKRQVLARIHESRYRCVLEEAEAVHRRLASNLTQERVL